AAQHAVEVEPRGAAQVLRVGDQPVTAEVAPEQPLPELDQLLGVAAVEPVRDPGLLARLDDHGGEIAAELVRMDLEPAVLGSLEGEREGREVLRRAEADEAALADLDVRVEMLGVHATRAAVDAVRRDHE